MNFDITKYLAKKGKITSKTLLMYTAIEALDTEIISLHVAHNYEFVHLLTIVSIIHNDVYGFQFLAAQVLVSHAMQGSYLTMISISSPRTSGGMATLDRPLFFSMT